MYKVFLLCVACFSLSVSHAQDSAYTRLVLEELCSKKMYGRGYVFNGIKNAENFLIKEIKSTGAQPVVGKHYTQAFTQDVTVFQKTPIVSINGTAMKAGFDFIPNANCSSISGSTGLIKKDSITYFGSINGRYVQVQTKRKLTYTVGHAPVEQLLLEVDKTKFTETPENLSVEIKTKYIKEFKVNNIACQIKGSSAGDSLIVFTAHYDHLGGLGKACYFPGANDNASGVSMVLNLLKHYATHPPKYTTVFVFFAGEEAGLLGSSFFVNHPPFDLKKIKFLINLDLLGTGEEGIMVVNGAVFTKEFEMLQDLNSKNALLPQVKKRGKAANSDHYFFTEKGVPCFFIYTLGGVSYYHDVYDVAKTLPLTKYKAVFELLTQFVKQF